MRTMLIAKEAPTFGALKERIVTCGENKLSGKHIAQLIVVLLCALTLKQFYSTANVNELRWVLAPTALLVELVSGSRFQFEAYAGYINSDHSFLIAASCAGVNFLLTAFMMLSLGKLWRDRSRNVSWLFIPAAAVAAYVTTLIANTVRIATALRLRSVAVQGWLDAQQLHRLEGILVYFGFLLLLFVVSQKMSYETGKRVASRTIPGREFLFPLLIYYAVALGIPIVTSLYRPGLAVNDLRQHLSFVVIVPPILILTFAIFAKSKRNA